MGLLDLILHAFNFAAPAFAVAVVLALVAPLFMPKGPKTRTWIAQAAINFVAGLVALGAGLWFFGNDGKMASYGALLLACCLSQGLLGRR